MDNYCEEQFELALQCYKNCTPDVALKAIDSALEKSPEHIPYLTLKSKILFSLHHYFESAKLFERITARTPLALPDFYKFMYAQMQCREFEYVKRAICARFYSTEVPIDANTILCQAIEHTDGKDAAIHFLSALIAQYPNTVIYHYRIAELFYQSNLFEAALQEALYCQSCQPDSRKILYLLLKLYMTKYGYGIKGKFDPNFSALYQAKSAQRLCTLLLGQRDFQIEEITLLFQLGDGRGSWNTNILHEILEKLFFVWSDDLALLLLPVLVRQNGEKHILSIAHKFMVKNELEKASLCYSVLAAYHHVELFVYLSTLPNKKRMIQLLCKTPSNYNVIFHIKKHCKNDLSKEKHGIFLITWDKVNELLCNLSQFPYEEQYDYRYYHIPVPRAGYMGGKSGDGRILNYITVITWLNTENIITAYPSD